MQLYKSALAALAIGSMAAGCSGAESKTENGSPTASGMGEMGMALTLPDDSNIATVSYSITGPAGFSRTGSVPVANSSKLAFRVGSLPIQNGYTIALSASTSFGEPCMGSQAFNVLDNETTTVAVLLTCNATDDEGDLIVNGAFQSCPLVTTLQAIPAEVFVGATMAFTAGISHGDSDVAWTATDGTFLPAVGYNTTYTCTSSGVKTITAAITGLAAACNDTLTMTVECTTSIECGNGTTQGTEQCDDGDTVNNDECTNNCTLPRCGDGIEQTGEECDDGNGSNADLCSTTCLDIVCGNTRVDPGEDCDDGNTVNTDACPNSCQVGCGDGIVTAPEVCDDGNTSNTDACTNACLGARCGDGFVQAGETCDDGNTAGGDACPATCVQAAGDAANQIAACATCRQTNCNPDQDGLPIYQNCFFHSDPVFVQQCVDLRNCIYNSGEGYDPALGPVETFCGTADDAACTTPGGANGDCIAAWYAAGRTTVLNEMLGNFGNIGLPAGNAYYLSVCDRDYCGSSCVPTP